jgi:hypothetical protein
MYRSRGTIPRLRRPDPQRSPGAGGLPARLAPLMTREEVAGIAVPVLIAVGTRRNRGFGGCLGKIIPAPRCSIFPTATMALATGSKAGVLDFLSRRK